MASQNLVSGTVGPEKLSRILGKIAEISEELDVCKPLLPEDIQGIIKVGNGYSPFLDRAFRVANDNPELMPRLLNLGELNQDYSLALDLTKICEKLEILFRGVQDTLMAARSDAMVASLEVYAAAKANSDRVPGLKVVAADMGEVFKRSKVQASPAAKAAQGAKL